MLRAIVGVEIPIARIVGKWKMSQTRPLPDRVGVVAGLQAESDGSAHDVAQVVAETLARGE